LVTAVKSDLIQYTYDFKIYDAKSLNLVKSYSFGLDSSMIARWNVYSDVLIFKNSNQFG